MRIHWERSNRLDSWQVNNQQHDRAFGNSSLICIFFMLKRSEMRKCKIWFHTGDRYQWLVKAGADLGGGSLPPPLILWP